MGQFPRSFDRCGIETTGKIPRSVRRPARSRVITHSIALVSRPQVNSSIALVSKPQVKFRARSGDRRDQGPPRTRSLWYRGHRSISALGQETGAIKGHHARDRSVIETTGQSLRSLWCPHQSVALTAGQFPRSFRKKRDHGSSRMRLFWYSDHRSIPWIALVPSPERGADCRSISALGQETVVIKGHHAITEFVNL